jgi:integrase
MATFKAVILKHQGRGDKTFSIKIRITHNRRSKYINTDLVVTKDDITKSFKLKNYFFTEETNKLIQKYRDICNRNSHLLKDMDINQVLELITKVEKPDVFSLNIIEYGRKCILTLIKNKRIKTASLYQTSLNSLIRFRNSEKIDINEITSKFLSDWIDYIEGGRAKSLYPACLRKLHNDAKREYNIEELGIVKIPLSPFSTIRLPKEPKPEDIDISIEKVKQIFNLKDKTHRYNLARDVFILSFCLWGTNAKDLYECSDYENERIIYNRAKTKNRREDKAKISIKVEPEIIPLVEKYKDKTNQRVFCFYQMYSDIGTFNAAIGKGLRQIRKDIDVDYLVFYSARHSFATILTNDINIDRYIVHQMLNHVIGEMKITDRYIRKDWRPLDIANRKLFDYMFQI